MQYKVSDVMPGITGDNVDYSQITDALLTIQENDLCQQGMKYGYLTAIFVRHNALFSPIVMVLRRFASEILFLNENSLERVNSILQISYYVTDVDAGDIRGYSKTIVSIWKKNVYLYVKESMKQKKQKKANGEINYLFMTSGTTGAPDIIYKKSSVLEKEGRAIAEKLRYTRNDKILAIIPPYHAYCNAYACFAPASVGASVTYMNNIVTRQSIINTMRAGGFSVIITTPFYYDQILDTEELNIPRLRVCSGCAITERMKKSTIKFNNAYGTTETGALCIELYENGGSNEDVGTEYNGVRIIVDEKKQNVNESVISVETDYLMFKRIRNGKTQYIYGKKWILNDIGRRDSQGNIVIVGRNDNIVNIAGEKISLREIEEKIYEIPNVREVKVKAEMDKNNNTYISAYISLYDRSAEINIRKELMGKLPLSKIPKKVEIRDALSRTSTGKIKENQ
ncbi:MAG: AMP-binding protein [Lachnospiraceae bacterium]|jgi:phenylalanine racemase